MTDSFHPDTALTGEALLTLGQSQDRAADFQRLQSEGLTPGLISKSYGSLGGVWTPDGPVNFAAAGRLRLTDKQTRAGLPAVGDWVALRRPDTAGSNWLVQEILPRKTSFWRKMAGTSHKAQIVAANMDVIFIVSSLNRDYNPRRLERYLSLARESGAQPVVVLSKADLAGDELDSYVEETLALAQDTPVHSVSAVSKEGLAEIENYLQPGKMVALLGSSGVGKSTLINHWLGGEYLRVNEIRNDERGRHTTTHRELIRLPGGALVIDTPGMREVQLLDHEGGVEDAFEDITALAEKCRFTDCTHGNEPGCAVLQAINNEELDEDRLDHYRLLRDELKQAEAKRLEMERRAKSRPQKRSRRP